MQKNYPLIKTAYLATLILLLLPILSFAVLPIFLGDSLKTDTLQHVLENLFLTYLLESVSLILLSSLFAVLFALPSAYLLSKYKLPSGKLLYWLNILPLSIPTYISGYIWADLMSKSGELYGLLSPFLGSFQWLGLVACGFVFGTVLYPYLFIQLYSAFSEKYHNYSIASSSLGKSKIEFIKKIGFRIMLFPLASGLFLVAVETLNDYGAVKYYGVNTFTFGIFKVWFGLGDLGTALLLSIVLVSSIVGLKLIVDSFKLGSDSIKASQNKIKISQLSKKSLLLIITSLPPIICLIIPTLYSLYSADYRDIEKLFELGSVGFLSTSIGEAILNTAYLSGSSTFVVLTFSVIFVISNYIFNKGKSPNLLQQLSIGGYYVPGAVVALSVMALFVAIGSVADSLFQVYLGIGSWLLAPILLAYTFRYFQVCYSPIQNAFSGLAAKSVDMSRSLGKSLPKSIFRIGFPVIKLEIIAATLIVFIDIAKDLPLTLILRDYGQETLATMAYRYANDERLAESMPYGLLIIAVSLLSVIISIAVSSKRRIEIDK